MNWRKSASSSRSCLDFCKGSTAIMPTDKTVLQGQSSHARAQFPKFAKLYLVLSWHHSSSDFCFDVWWGIDRALFPFFLRNNLPQCAWFQRNRLLQLSFFESFESTGSVTDKVPDKPELRFKPNSREFAGASFTLLSVQSLATDPQSQLADKVWLLVNHFNSQRQELQGRSRHSCAKLLPCRHEVSVCLLYAEDNVVHSPSRENLWVSLDVTTSQSLCGRDCAKEAGTLKDGLRQQFHGPEWNESFSVLSLPHADLATIAPTFQEEIGELEEGVILDQDFDPFPPVLYPSIGWLRKFEKFWQRKSLLCLEAPIVQSSHSQGWNPLSPAFKVSDVPSDRQMKGMLRVASTSLKPKFCDVTVIVAGTISTLEMSTI